MTTDLSTMCRICMKECLNFTNISSVDTDFVEFNVKLYFCVPSINIDNEYFPQKICVSCTNDLKISYNFKQRCLTSTSNIKDILDKQDEDIIQEESIIVKYEDIIEEKLSENITEEPEVEENELNDSVETNDEDNKHSDVTEEDKIDEEDNIDELINETFQNAIEEEYDDDHSYFNKNVDDVTEEDIIDETTESNIINIKQELLETNLQSDNSLTEQVLNPIFPNVLLEPEMEISTDIIMPEIAFIQSPRRLNSANKKNFPDDFFCTLCDVSFSKAKLTVHRKKHVNEEKISCPRCSRSFDGQKELLRFFRHYCPDQNGPSFLLTCMVCYRKFKTTQALSNHKKVHANKVGVFKCRLCCVMFKSEQKLDWHYRNGIHTDKKTHKLTTHNI